MSLLVGPASDEEKGFSPAGSPHGRHEFVELQTPTGSSSSSSASSSSAAAAATWFGASDLSAASELSLSAVDPTFAKGGSDSSGDLFASDKRRYGEVSYVFGPGFSGHDQMFPEHDPDSAGLQQDGSVVQSENREADSSGSSGSEPSQSDAEAAATRRVSRGSHAKLSQWLATAICGNDITSSCFYVTGLAVASGGVFAPICMLLVAATLRLFCSVYGEAVTALPLNGGAYNVLLNTTSKKTAAVAACLSILSYMATAVVSASSAIAYLQYIYPDTITTLGVLMLLLVFAALCLWGITDSARVALAIFVFHITTLLVLTLSIVVWLCRHGTPSASYNLNLHGAYNPPPVTAIVYGFAAATLGVSGFETSANFVEEQREGVFVLTLRNMWALVAFFNPALCLLALLVFDADFIAADANINVTLALLAEACAGDWLKYWVCIDAFLVLSGAVLTAFVGVTGLARRLAMDRCLPELLLRTNRWRGTNHTIIFGFLAVCASLYLVLNGDVSSLARVYSVSFLCVMSLFAIANMLLKHKRSYLPRQVKASWPTCLGALTLAIVALIGVIVQDTTVLTVWLLYFVIVAGCFSVMFMRAQVLRLFYHALHGTTQSLQRIVSRCLRTDWRINDGPVLNAVLRLYHELSSQPVVFFVRRGVQLGALNKAVLYVLANEEARHVRLVHCYGAKEEVPPGLLLDVHVLDREYPRMRIDLVLVRGVFGPAMIDWLQTALHIPRNLMFMGCPRKDFKHRVDELGGVRIIAGS